MPRSQITIAVMVRWLDHRDRVAVGEHVADCVLDHPTFDGTCGRRIPLMGALRADDERTHLVDVLAGHSGHGGRSGSPENSGSRSGTTARYVAVTDTGYQPSIGRIIADERAYEILAEGFGNSA
jgi:hypothetical protein